MFEDILPAALLPVYEDYNFYDMKPSGPCIFYRLNSGLSGCRYVINDNYPVSILNITFYHPLESVLFCLLSYGKRIYEFTLNCACISYCISYRVSPHGKPTDCIYIEIRYLIINDVCDKVCAPRIFCGFSAVNVEIALLAGCKFKDRFIRYFKRLFEKNVCQFFQHIHQFSPNGFYQINSNSADCQAYYWYGKMLSLVSHFVTCLSSLCPV